MIIIVMAARGVFGKERCILRIKASEADIKLAAAHQNNISRSYENVVCR